MRATLWQQQTEVGEIVREVLRGLFKLAGIDFIVVDTGEDLLAAASKAQRLGDRDILVIDCSAGDPEDVTRCVPIVTGTRLSVHIVHPREQAVRDLEQVAGRPLVWFSTTSTLPDLLDKLHLLRAIAAQAADAPVRPPLTEREREVARLLADGRTNGEIATALHITGDTAKTHVRTIMQKFGVRSREEFGRQYRADG